MRICTECDRERAKKGEEKCVGCLAAITDDRPDRPGESPYDLDDLGTWRFDSRRGVEVFVPASPKPADEPVIEVLAGPLPDGVYESDLRTCDNGQCGSRFLPKTTRHRYCSESCKDAAYYMRRKAREQVAA